MSEEKNGRYYKESSEKLALKIGINRATRSGTKAPYGTAGCKERRRLPLHRNILETKYVLVCYNDIWYHVYVRRHYSHSAIGLQKFLPCEYAAHYPVGDISAQGLRVVLQQWRKQLPDIGSCKLREAQLISIQPPDCAHLPVEADIERP